MIGIEGQEYCPLCREAIQKLIQEMFMNDGVQE